MNTTTADAQPVEAHFTDRPMYRFPFDESDAPRPFTITVAGSERHEGHAPHTMVVEACDFEAAALKALIRHMTESNDIDTYVIGELSFAGLPAEDCGYVWTDWRPCADS